MNADRGTRMNPAAKALWYVESHFTREITLEEVAEIAGVSRYHMSRAFGLAIGYPITRYVCGRRLTEAARQLATGAPDILSLAPDVGYGSHEAFSRAFRDPFGMTPEAVRAQRHVNNIELVEAIRIEETLEETLIDLKPPRFENRPSFLVAGLSESYNRRTCAGIPAQWQRFGPHIGRIPGQLGHTAYGICCNADDAGNMDYICAVEVSDSAVLPADLTRLRIAAQRYAVFAHRDHISKIRGTWHTIFNKWLPESGCRIVPVPAFEVYNEQFDPRAGTGDVEIRIPVEPRQLSCRNSVMP